jgi:hypothetical protein
MAFSWMNIDYFALCSANESTNEPPTSLNIKLNFILVNLTTRYKGNRQSITNWPSSINDKISLERYCELSCVVSL